MTLVSKFDFNLRDNSLLYVRYAQGSQTSLWRLGKWRSSDFPRLTELC